MPKDGEYEGERYRCGHSVPAGLARPGERKSVSLRFGCFNLNLAILAALCAVIVVGEANIARAQLSDAEKTSYTDALAYCRGDVARPMALRTDRQVLCLDGRIHAVNEISIAAGLERGGLFVVRSDHVELTAALLLADMLLVKEATVVINEFCLAICANYLFIASLKTFVPKNALVAWINHPTGSDNCFGFYDTRDPTAPYFREAPCTRPYDARTDELLELKDKFYKGRVHAPPFIEPPESVTVRRILKRKFDATGKYPYDFFWTWNPRYYASAIRTNVIYEAYPQSQVEVDALRARIGLQPSVIYDP